jgi:RNase P subunit RPR2
MVKKLSKSKAQEEIEEFFKKIKEKTPKEIKKTKRLAMKHNIPLKEKRKLFCKNCLTPYKNPKIRIKKNMKVIGCEECGYVARWKIKT